MADQDAYRRYARNAEALLAELQNGGQTPPTAAALASSAQTWAMLALAAAQERVQPADRPQNWDGPAKVRDGEGDVWVMRNGLYWLALGRPDIQSVGYTLEMIAKAHDGYTEVP